MSYFYRSDTYKCDKKSKNKNSVRGQILFIAQFSGHVKITKKYCILHVAIKLEEYNVYLLQNLSKTK